MVVQTLDRVLLFEKTLCPFRRSFSVELPEPPMMQKRPWSPPSREDCTATVPGATGVANSSRGGDTSASEIHTVQGGRRKSPVGITVQMQDGSVEARGSSATTQQYSQPKGASRASGCLPIYDHSSTCEAITTTEPLTELSLRADDESANEAGGAEELHQGPKESKDLLEGSGSEGNLRHPRLRYFLGTYARRTVTSPAHLATSNASSSSGIAKEGDMQSPTAELHVFRRKSSSGRGQRSSSASHLLPGASTDLCLHRQKTGRAARTITALRSKDSGVSAGRNDKAKFDVVPATQDGPPCEIIPEAGGSMCSSLTDEVPTPTSDVSQDPLVVSPLQENHGAMVMDGRHEDHAGGFHECPVSSAIVTRTNDILLGPPSHLIAIMLRIAARICDGEWKGRDEYSVESGKVMPVRWDYSIDKLAGVEGSHADGT